MKLLIKANEARERCSDIAIARDEVTGQLFVVVSSPPNIYDLAPAAMFEGYDSRERKIKPDSWFAKIIVQAAYDLDNGYATLIQHWPQAALRANTLHFLGRDFSVLGPEYILETGQPPRLRNPKS
jgi:hypothetical protein